MLVVLSLAACGKPPGGEVEGDAGRVDSGAPATDAGTSDAGAVDAGTPDAGTGIDPTTFTLTFPPEFVPVGAERTRCVVLDVGNNQPAKIGAMHLQTSGPPFRFELYATDDALAETPTDCPPLQALTEASHKPLLLSYSHDETVSMQADVAFTFTPHQHLLLVLHSWNATSGAEDASATVTLTATPTATHEAAFVVLMNIDAVVPQKNSATMIANFPGVNGLAEYARFFSIAGYGQRFGSEFQIYEVDNQQFPSQVLIDQTPYDFSNSARWSGTPFTLPFDHYFHLQCSWVNPLSVDAHSGAGVDDLLCAVGGYYYGTSAPQLCAFTNTPSPSAICCPGDAKCADLF